MNYYPVTVIDNFYKKPDAVRDFALGQEYKFCHELTDINYVFPGCRTKDLSTLNFSLYEQVCRKLVSVFHNTDHDYMRWAISTSFQSVSETYQRGLIHQDTCIFSGVLYLSPDAPLTAGTSLFRKNGKFNEASYKAALDENDLRFRSNKEVSWDYHEMFDEVVRVNNVYNTLILFEGDIFHCANDFFGKTLQDSRLAQVFFINRIDARTESSFPLKRVGNINV